jgi:hypothetical protein
MKDMGTRLMEDIKRHKKETGLNEVLVVVEKAEQQIGLHSCQVDYYYGLLVDGKPPTLQWYQEAEDFHLLQVPAVALH